MATNGATPALERLDDGGRRHRAQIVFRHRFRPFQELLSPPPLSYQQFRDNIDAGAQAVRSCCDG